MIKNNYSIFIPLLILLVSACTKEKETLPPNIIFILADDLGWKDLSYMGSTFYETPHIDRLSEESFSFLNGYAASRVCSPSRASIMTGQFPARHGITDWIGARADTNWRKQNRFTQLLPPEYVRNLPEGDTTLAEAFLEAGYQTFFAGKWHLGGQGSWPEDHGFQINKGGWDSGSPRGGYFSPWKNPNLPNQKKGENLSLRLADETVRFLKSHHPDATGQPIFAFLSFYAVHGPIQTTQTKWAKYRDKADSLGIAPKGFEMGHFLPIRQVQDNPIYAGLVETMDEATGRVLQALDELQLSDNTIVVFTSDNGGVAAGDNYSTSNRPLKAGKGYQFEGGIREPFLIKVPWLSQQVTTVKVPASGVDFYPTLLELAGIPLKPTQHTDGVSLLPALKGETMADRPLIWHYPHYGNQGGEPSSIIRLGDWKLIHYHEDDHKELYDLSKDMGEEKDLSAIYPEKTEALFLYLSNYLDQVDARFPKKDPFYDPEKEKAFLKKIKNKRLPNLEEKRLLMLQEDYKPGNDWWGSQIK